VFAPGGASLQNKLFGLFDNSFVGGRIRISIEADEKVTGVSLNDSTQNMVVILRKGMAIYDDSIARWLGAGFETAMSLMQVTAVQDGVRTPSRKSSLPATILFMA
jgi:hypothetical protein